MSSCLPSGTVVWHGRKIGMCPDRTAQGPALGPWASCLGFLNPRHLHQLWGSNRRMGWHCFHDVKHHIHIWPETLMNHRGLVLTWFLNPNPQLFLFLKIHTDVGSHTPEHLVGRDPDSPLPYDLSKDVCWATGSGRSRLGLLSESMAGLLTVQCSKQIMKR